MAMASSTMDLRLLKKLAMNSLTYNNLKQEQKDKCMAMWSTKWHNSVRLEDDVNIEIQFN